MATPWRGPTVPAKMLRRFGQFQNEFMCITNVIMIFIRTPLCQGKKYIHLALEDQLI